MELEVLDRVIKVESVEPSLLKKSLSTLISESSVKHLIQKILHSTLLLEEIANRSYCHDNGFDKIVIAKGNDLQLRIHIWWDGIDIEGQPNIHNHRWNFASYLLCGEYKHEEFVLRQSAPEMIKAHAYIYQPRGETGFYGLIENGDSGLELISTTILGKGDFLVSYHDQLHRVMPNRRLTTATIFLNGKVEKATTDVYSYRQLITSKKQDSKAMQPQVLQDRLERLLAVNCFD